MTFDDWFGVGLVVLLYGALAVVFAIPRTRRQMVAIMREVPGTIVRWMETLAGRR